MHVITEAAVSLTGVNIPAGAAAGAPDFDAAPVVPLLSEPPARITVDAPLTEPLRRGYVVIRYRVSHARIAPVYGPAALDVSPRLGHLHITVDDLPWRWLDAGGEPLSITGLPPGPHKVLIELVDTNHQVMDRAVIRFDVPTPSATSR
ncbi:MAG: DUF6130 family protein [Planctomycetota bacterium]|nr:DUF6130 family protein [Planctomycetota bacterium]